MRISIIQLNYKIADFSYNFNKMSIAIHKYHKSDLIVFSELCITGYYPYDLLLYPQIFIEQNKIINKIKDLTRILNTAVVIGVATHALYTEKKFYNSALIIQHGEVVHHYNKQLIPNYGVFDETRHFIPGRDFYPEFNLNGKSLAILICEDIWYENKQGYLKNPIDNLSTGLDALIIINASPSSVGKFKTRLNRVKKIIQKINAPVIYSSQVGGYDELVYDGASFVCNQRLELVALADSFKEASLSIDLNKLPKKILRAPYSYQGGIDTMILHQLMCGLKDYVYKCGFKGVIVGSSGGIDSALTLTIATLSLGKENVKAITMPSIYSSKKSVSDSIKLCQNLDIKLIEYEIKDEFLLACKNFEKVFRSKPKKITKENIQARIRGRVIMEYSNNNGVLVLASGNKSELSVGYTTLYGDMCGGLNCIGDLYKSDVYRLSDYINKIYYQIIPQSILDKEPSAELSENQKDSDSLPKYPYLDAMLKLYIERDALKKGEVQFLEKINSEILPEEKEKIYSLVEFSEFKRKQAPQIIFIRSHGFGIGRRIPTGSQFNKLS